MRMPILILAAALAIAGCNKGAEQGKPAAGAGSAPSGAADKAPPSQSQVNTPTTPAPGTPASGGATASQEDKKAGGTPVQGQVDPQHSDQHRDFQHKGDAAGPKGVETLPKQGN